jgi:hypothetical protein
VERTFSAAADIAIPARGALKPKTISRAVGCRQWLQSYIPVTGRFSDAINYVTSFAANMMKKKKDL